MKIEIHVYHHLVGSEDESLSILKKIHKGLVQGEFVMPLSPEMQNFVDASTAAFTSAGESLANISADIQRLLSSSTGLSEEDKIALVDATNKLNDLSVQLATAAAVVPES